MRGHFSMNAFVLLILLLLGVWIAWLFGRWGVSCFEDHKEYVRRVRLGLSRRFKKRAYKASVNLRNGLAVSLLVVICSWAVYSEQSADFSDFAQISVRKDDFSKCVVSIKNLILGNSIVLDNFSDVMSPLTDQLVCQTNKNGCSNNSSSLINLNCPNEELSSSDPDTKLNIPNCSRNSTKCCSVNQSGSCDELITVNNEICVEADEGEFNLENNREFESVNDKNVDAAKSSENELDNKLDKGGNIIAYVPYVGESAVAQDVSQDITTVNGMTQNKTSANGYIQEPEFSDRSISSVKATSLNESYATPVNVLRVPEPVFAETVNDAFFVNTILTDSEASLLKEFVASKVEDNHILSTSTAFTSNAYGDVSLVGYAGKEHRGNETVLEQLNREVREVCSTISRFYLPVKAFKSSKNNSSHEETGSSFLISYCGKVYVVTNGHVINCADGNESIQIFLPDGSYINPVDYYLCPDFDVAVLEIDQTKLPDDGSVSCCQFADSDSLDVGSMVFAVGSPFGLNKSVAYGYVSSLRRCNQDLERDSKKTLPEYIQIDASINPGNSGGPLCNRRGEVVGVVSAIATTTGKNEGVAFAIPSNILLRVVKNLIDNGEWNRSLLGVELAPASRADLVSTKLSRVFGAKVLKVQARSAAVNSGLRAGDVVVAFNGRQVLDDKDLARKIALAPSAESVRLSVVRGKHFFEMEAKLKASQTVSRR